MFQACYSDLTSKGVSEAAIRESLLAKFRSEKGRELNDNELKCTQKIMTKDQELRYIGLTKPTTLLKDSFNKVTATNEKIDTVDSNVGKLMCEVCNTSFNNSALLERHMKYSFFHDRAVQNRDQLKRLEKRAHKIALLVHNNLQIVRRVCNQRDTHESNRYSKTAAKWQWAYKQVKHQNAILRTTAYLMNSYRSNLKTQNSPAVKLLYHGSKHLWRSQQTIELHIYLHDGKNVTNNIPNISAVLEIVGFDASKQKELVRLYTNLDIFSLYS